MRGSLILVAGLLLALAGCASETFQAVTFASTDGLELSGRLFGEGDTAVVLAHMYPADQGSWKEFAQELAEKGYMAVTFDFRGYGRSQGPKEVSQMDRDVEGALDFAKARGARSVFLAGASMG